ncbi:MAG TPA: acetyl-CoA carboxylase carboxyltransferase subunit alpha [Victivallales bacterium]|nr:acetyl-CoA carboxylase carboxyltransferase subunit alpha [Victivallales bacterium]HRR29309.1 acetyl-CoA carboxylase carboxyltransferase subunit alpha [Victivallales bacterium]HRU01519.1 acetyl-CoA carboxylase carboxyltransferase subunit alpha [Victivallales bacterium]
MASVILDFEKPIYELESKIEELQRIGSSTNVDVENEILKLREKVNETKKSIYQKLNPWQKVQLARHPDRPYTLDYISRIFSDFMELHGDRRYAEDPAIVGGFAKLGNQPVMLIGTQKGRNIKENVHRNFGCPHPEGYRKALRLMKLAEKAGKPIISFIDTPGAFPGIASEERHIGEAIAVNLREMFSLEVPFIAVVIGEGGSGGALGIGVGDKIALLENAYYSVITPEGCAAILWKDRAYSSKAAEALKLTASDLIKLGIIDDIIPEPLGGAHRNWDEAAGILKKYLEQKIEELFSVSKKNLLENRYLKYRKIGFFNE